MNVKSNIAHLKRTISVLPTMVEDLTDEEFRWKPESGNWSILEILGHMLVEETQDFRMRLRLTLADPEQPWPPYDPEGVVIAERFNERCPRQTLQEFLDERVASVEWLHTLTSPDWNKVFEHERIGSIRAGDLFVSWVVHDQLHFRQLVKRRFELINEDAQPFKTSYAGKW